MRHLMMSAAAMTLAMTGAAFAQDDDSQMSRADLFDQIDANDNDMISRSEFRTYARDERDMTADRADAAYDEMRDDEEEVTLVLFERTPVITAWVAPETDDRQENERQAMSNQTMSDTKDTDKNYGKDTAEKKAEDKSMEARDDWSEKSSTEKMRSAQRSDTMSTSPANDWVGTGHQNFTIMDENGDRKISRAEFTSFIAAADNVTKRDARRLFNVAAGDDKMLTHAEFIESGEKLDAVADRVIGDKVGQNMTGERGANASASSRNASSNDRSSSMSKRSMSGDMKISFEEMDEDGDGEVRRSEFLEYVRNHAERHFDRASGNDSALTRSEMEKIDHHFIVSMTGQGSNPTP